MFKLDKNTPTFFQNAVKKVKHPLEHHAWSDKNIRSIGAELREHILREEQDLLCAYCEKQIDSSPKNSNIDHFKTRNLFPELTLNYHNLFVSCNNRKRCSFHKDNRIKEKREYDHIIHPVIENPDDFLEYLLTGDIVPSII